MALLFLARECSTSTAPAVLALRYDCPLLTGICYRVTPTKWRIDFGPQIPTLEGDANRAIADIMRDVNRVYKAAVRRDPANWFWVHDRWKYGGTDSETWRDPLLIRVWIALWDDFRGEA